MTIEQKEKEIFLGYATPDKVYKEVDKPLVTLLQEYKTLVHNEAIDECVGLLTCHYAGWGEDYWNVLFTLKDN